MAVETIASSPRGSLLTDQRFRAIAYQVIVVVGLAAFLWFIVQNTAFNLEKRGITTGFEFLSQPAGYDIATSLIPYNTTMTHGPRFSRLKAVFSTINQRNATRTTTTIT